MFCSQQWLSHIIHSCFKIGDSLSFSLVFLFFSFLLRSLSLKKSNGKALTSNVDVSHQTILATLRQIC